MRSRKWEPRIKNELDRLFKVARFSPEYGWCLRPVSPLRSWGLTVVLFHFVLEQQIRTGNAKHSSNQYIILHNQAIKYKALSSVPATAQVIWCSFAALNTYWTTYWPIIESLNHVFKLWNDHLWIRLPPGWPSHRYQSSSLILHQPFPQPLPYHHLSPPL